MNNLCDAKEFIRAYEGLLRHYRISGQKIQSGQANENGDVEQRHYRFKQAAEQALMMRGSREFPVVAAYQVFLSKLFVRLNAGRRERYLDEVAQLGPLPEQRLDSVRRERVRVSPGSLLTVHRNIYSVHSRLIGEMEEARVGPDAVEIWYGDRKVEELLRLRGGSESRTDRRSSRSKQILQKPVHVQIGQRGAMLPGCECHKLFFLRREHFTSVNNYEHMVRIRFKDRLRGPVPYSRDAERPIPATGLGIMTR